jgi:hypothetical protein
MAPNATLELLDGADPRAYQLMEEAIRAARRQHRR